MKLKVGDLIKVMECQHLGNCSADCTGLHPIKTIKNFGDTRYYEFGTNSNVNCNASTKGEKWPRKLIKV